MQKINLFENITLPSDDAERTDDILTNENIVVKRIISPKSYKNFENEWFKQAEEEWVLLLQGNAKLKFENNTIEMKVGDMLHIPANTKHQIISTSQTIETIWLAIHYNFPKSYIQKP